MSEGKEEEYWDEKEISSDSMSLKKYRDKLPGDITKYIYYIVLLFLLFVGLKSISVLISISN